MEKKALRAFIAFELPPAVVDLAGDLQARIKAYKMNLRWVRPQNMHLTLKFLGDIGPDQVGAISGALHEAARHMSPMALTVQGMGVFPGLRKPRVFWIGVGGATDMLQKAYSLVEEHMALLGFQREARTFKAHLTLARINPPVDARLLLEIIQMEGGYAAKPFQVHEVALFQSVLKPQGPIYTPLAKASLEGVAQDG